MHAFWGDEGERQGDLLSRGADGSGWDGHWHDWRAGRADGGERGAGDWVRGHWGGVAVRGIANRALDGDWDRGGSHGDGCGSDGVADGYTWGGADGVADGHTWCGSDGHNGHHRRGRDVDWGGRDNDWSGWDIYWGSGHNHGGGDLSGRWDVDGSGLGGSGGIGGDHGDQRGGDNGGAGRAVLDGGVAADDGDVLGAVLGHLG